MRPRPLCFFFAAATGAASERCCMKQLSIGLGLILACGCGLQAQTAAPVDVKVCDVVKNPAAYNGKMVRITGTIVQGFDEFSIKDPTDPNCGFQENTLWLSYPEGTKAKSGPVAVVTLQPAHNFSASYKAPERTPVTLDKSKDFKKFDALLAQTHQKGADMCLGCARYDVTATLVGRLDGVADPTLQRDKSGKITGFGGFGNMNGYPARLVLQSVSNVTSKEIDYAKTDAVASKESSETSAPDISDPFAMAQKIVDVLKANPAGEEENRALAVFPQKRDGNGVSISYGMGNDVAPEQPGIKDSPDGVLFNCTFNRDRLQGKAMVLAIFHIGEHVADLRSPKPGNESAPVIFNENNAWVVTSLAAVVDGQKFLTLPGGYMLWNKAWPGDQRNDKIESALKSYLANEALLSQ